MKNTRKYFKIGQRVKSLKSIVFKDGTKHDINEILTVEKNTKSYFEFFYLDYEVLKGVKGFRNKK